jgi:hypothetical protein
MLSWFIGFYGNVSDLTNVSNTNVDHIKRAFWNIFINIDYEKAWFELSPFIWNWFLYFASIYVNKPDVNINQQLRCNNVK